LRVFLGDNIDFTWSFPEPFAVWADPAQLSQVFSNLVSNARDAMPDGGRIHISVRQPAHGETYEFGLVPDPETYIHLCVEDTGVGMTESVLLHAFDPLFTTKNHGGTGLGLAVAHQAVTKHGGFIFAESTPGIGSTFHLFLPRAESAFEPESVVQPETLPRSRRILIVDDEPSIVEGVSEVLREMGMTVGFAGTGREAMQLVEELDPEIAIVDIRLPDVDGLRLAEALRTVNPDLDVVFASGHGGGDVVFAGSPQRFLQKPFSTETLLRTLAALDKGKPS
jgi:CheY-like chemotaxis protein